MIIKQVRLSQQAKDQLSRLKGKTGIKNWNILCRWALCYSLAEKTLPTDIPLASDSNLEMSWYTFGGEYYEVYEALMIMTKQYCSISNGSACTSKSYSPSYVLKAMGIPEEEIECSVRISWGPDTSSKELKENLVKMIEIAKQIKG